MEHLADTIVYKLLAVQKKIIAEVKKDFTDAGFTHENYITLHFIYENPGISQTALALLNDKDKNVIVKTIDRLEKLGLVKRVPSAKDRRAHTLYVTEAGEKVAFFHWQFLIARQNEAMKPLTPQERESFCRLLNKILD